MSSKSKYPQRPPVFAQKVIRLLVKACAAQEIGQSATLLVVIVAATEDAARYRRPVWFYNTQLLPLLGLRKWEALDKARRAAVEAGWLHYEAPPLGKKKPGRYWVTIPAEALGLDDSPVDETDAEPYPANGDSEQKAYPPNGYGEGDGGGYGRGDSGGEHSFLTLSPNPSPKKAAPSTSKKLRFSDQDHETAKWMYGLILEMNPSHKKPNLEKWADTIRLIRERDNRADEEIRQLFIWANNHRKFWRAIILSPGKLRDKWDQLTIQRSQDAKGKHTHVPGPGQRHPDDAARSGF